MCLVIAGTVVLYGNRLVSTLIWGSWRQRKQGTVVRDVTAYLKNGNLPIASFALRDFKFTSERGVAVGDYRKVVKRIRSEFGADKLPADAPYDLMNPDRILYGFFRKGRGRLEGEEREIEKERLCAEFARAIQGDADAAWAYRSLLDFAVSEYHLISQEEADEIEARAMKLAEELQKFQPSGDAGTTNEGGDVSR